GVDRLERELARPGRKRDVGAERGLSRDRQPEAEIERRAVEFGHVGGRRSARPVAARSREREAVEAGAERRKGHVGGRARWRPVVVVVAAVLLVVAEARPLALAGRRPRPPLE